MSTPSIWTLLQAPTGRLSINPWTGGDLQASLTGSGKSASQARGSGCGWWVAAGPCASVALKSGKPLLTLRGNYLSQGWDGKVEEWTIRGVSTRIHELPPNANGAQLCFVNVAVHASRNSSFYFWCAR
jgi:hypothetical protein